MDANELLTTLDGLVTLAPQEVWVEAVERWDELRAEVITRLEAALEVVEAGEQCGVLPQFATYIAADRRDHAFLPMMVRMFRASSDTRHDLLGDAVTADGPNLLAALCPPGADISLLWEWFDDIPADASEALLISVLIEGMICIMKEGGLRREELVAGLREKLESRAYGTNSEAYAWVLAAVSDIQEQSLMDVARELFRAGLVDETIIDLEGFEENMAKANEPNDRLTYKPVDALAEFERWKKDWEEDDDDGLEDEPLITLPFERVEPKTGRNDPCPCGSGKKYKKCCGNPAEAY